MTIKNLQKNSEIDWSKQEVIDFSGADRWLSCGEQDRRIRLGQRSKPSVALLEGSSVHEAMQVCNTKKKNGHKVTVSNLLDSHMHYFETEISKPEVKQDLDWGFDSKNTISGRAKKWFPDYLTRIDPQVEPDWVEQPFIKEVNVNGHTFKVAGVIDLTGKITNKKTIVDYKTCKSIKSQNETDSSLQLSLYSFFTQLRQASFCCFVKSGNPYVAFVHSKRSPAQWTWALRVFSSVMKCVQSGLFPLANPDPRNWRCSPKFCGFWQDCRGKYDGLR